MKTIKDLPKSERPRERLEKFGSEALSAHLEPSEDDLEITKRLVEAGKILGIEVIDHIIITKNGFLSFKERGVI